MRIGIYGGAAYPSQKGVAQMILKGWNEDIKARLDRLNEMNAHEFETDEAYAYWIENGIPDEASDDDIQYIAENVEIYNDVCEAYLQAKFIDTINIEG